MGGLSLVSVLAVMGMASGQGLSAERVVQDATLLRSAPGTVLSAEGLRPLERVDKGELKVGYVPAFVFDMPSENLYSAASIGFRGEVVHLPAVEGEKEPSEERSTERHDAKLLDVLVPIPGAPEGYDKRWASGSCFIFSILGRSSQPGGGYSGQSSRSFSRPNLPESSASFIHGRNYEDAGAPSRCP